MTWRRYKKNLRNSHLLAEFFQYKSDTGKEYDFNTADTLNTLLINALLATNQLNAGEEYSVDFDHQLIETEKYDAKPKYKKFLGYRPGVAVIGDMIVGIENSDGNTNVRFHYYFATVMPVCRARRGWGFVKKAEWRWGYGF